jgi:hypothetical protein
MKSGAGSAAGSESIDSGSRPGILDHSGGFVLVLVAEQAIDE